MVSGGCWRGGELAIIAVFDDGDVLAAAETTDDPVFSHRVEFKSFVESEHDADVAS